MKIAGKGIEVTLNGSYLRTEAVINASISAAINIRGKIISSQFLKQ
jgi:hypothetical protein